MNKIIDKRIQKHRIIIDFEKTGYDYCLQQFVDNIVVDIKNVVTQREFEEDVSVTITLE